MSTTSCLSKFGFLSFMALAMSLRSFVSVISWTGFPLNVNASPLTFTPLLFENAYVPVVPFSNSNVTESVVVCVTFAFPFNAQALRKASFTSLDSGPGSAFKISLAL